VANAAAKIEKQNAVQAVFQSQVAQQDQDFSAAAQLSDLAANQASSGFAFSSGSNYLVRASGEQLSRRDAERIRNEGRVTATSLANQGLSLDAEAEQSRASVGNIGTSGLIKFGGSLLDSVDAYNRNRIRKTSL
jgi:hypothetical protein